MRWKLLLANLWMATSVFAQEPDQDQILANIRFQIPDLQEATLTLEELESSPYGDLKQGRLIINGQQKIPFLLSESSGHLLLLMANPIDVSLTEEEIAAEIEEQERKEKILASESHTTLRRFAEGRPSRGGADAPITIFEFSDFQCPYCAQASQVVEELLNRYPDDLRFVYMHYPLDFHDWARPAAIAADCAARQSDSAFWTIHDNLFDAQDEITIDSMQRQVRSWLAETNIDLDQWESCAMDESSAANQGVALQIDISAETAKRFGLTGTPAFFVNGYVMNGAQPMSAFEDMIAKIKADI